MSEHQKRHWESEISGSIVLYQNPAEDVLEAIRSFFSTPLRTSLFVLDNSPTDDLRAVVERTRARYMWNGRNLGFGAAHNIAIRQAVRVAPYHVILNPDVSFGPDTCSMLYAFMEANLDVGLAMPRILYPNSDEQRLCKLIPTPFDLLIRRFLGKMGGAVISRRSEAYELYHLNMDVPREIPSLSGCFMFIRTKAFHEVGGFDERYFMYMEDIDLCRRIGVRYKTVFYPYTFVIHGYSKGSYHNLKLLIHHSKSAILYFTKWGWFHDAGREALNSRTSIIEPDHT